MQREGPAGLATASVLAAQLPRAGLLTLVGSYLLLASAYNAVTPVFEAPDEHTHTFVVQHIAQGRGLPVQGRLPGGQRGGPWEQEGSQPPLYYWLVAPLFRLAGAQLHVEDLRYNHQNTMGQPALIGNENRFIHHPEGEGWPWRGYVLAVHLMRSVSTVLGLIAVLAAVWLGWLVFPGRGKLALAVGAVVAFNPQFLHVTASVSNDAAIIALATLAMGTLVAWWQQPTACGALALALTVALAMLAKLSGLVLLLFVLICLVGHAIHRRSARPALQAAILVILACAILAGWWYLRNQRLYGSWTGLEVMLGDQLRRDFRLGRWLRGLPEELWGVWLSSWGVFGWFTVMLPGWWYALYTGLVVGGLLGAWVAWRRRAAWVAWPAFWLLAAWWLVVLASLLRWLAMTKGGAGRLLFPAIGALAVLAVLGWRQLLGRLSDRALSLGLGTGLSALAALALVGVLRPAFGWPATIVEAQVPPGATRADVVFGDALRLVAVEAPIRVREGQRFALTLYWQLIEPLARDGYVAIRIDQTIAGEELDGGAWRRVPGRTWLAYPGNGNAPPDLLSAGRQVYVDRRVVTAPELAAGFPPGAASLRWLTYRLPIAAELTVHLYDMASASSWPAHDPSGRVRPAGFGLPIVIEPRLGGPDRRGLCAGEPVARFANGMSLFWLAGPTGAPSQPRTLELRPGETAFLEVCWSSGPPPGEDLSAFVHLAAASPQPLSQTDGPPATHGNYPTSLWPAKECLPARLTLRVPPAATAGADYRLLVGLYRPPPSMSRIAAFAADGVPWPDAAVHLATVHVRP